MFPLLDRPDHEAIVLGGGEQVLLVSAQDHVSDAADVRRLLDALGVADVDGLTPEDDRAVADAIQVGVARVGGGDDHAEVFVGEHLGNVGGQRRARVVLLLQVRGRELVDVFVVRHHEHFVVRVRDLQVVHQAVFFAEDVVFADAFFVVVFFP